MENSKKQVTLDTYNNTASEMALKFDATGTRIFDIQRAFSFFSKTDLKVIELGCGNGRDAKEILRYTQNYIGIDASEAMISLARHALPHNKDCFIVEAIENYDFPKEIDIIFSFASFLHVEKDVLVKKLREAYSCLNTGGIVYISTKYSPVYEEVLKRDEFGTRYYYHYNPEEIIETMDGLFSKHQVDFQYLRGQKWFTLILFR